MLEISPVSSFTPRRSTVRDPWDAEEARRTLAAAGQSGLSLATFARRHGLCDRQLYWWRSRLRTHSDLEPATRPFVRVCTQSLPSRETSGVEIPCLTPSSASRLASARRRWPRPLPRFAACRAELLAVDADLARARAV